MSDETIQRLSTEGVDPLALAGVNDGNLVQLAKRLGVRVSLRGETLTLQCPHSALERATQVAQAAVDATARKRGGRIILARPAVEDRESLGFLPGDLLEKVDPYLRPLYDALEDRMPRDRVQKAIESRTIEIAPLAYMRGRTLSDAFVILDEAQNATGMQMKMFLTRLGVNSRAVITGDKTQIDL